MTEAAARFDDRVQDYLRGRPGYPRQILDVVRAARGDPPPARLADFRLDWTVADIGAGTGLLARPFLEAGCTVRLVEPNDEMRAAARATVLSPKATFLGGNAEGTGLPNQSVDAIVAGQAFHWFDAPAAAAEWRRILRPGGVVAVVHNRRKLTGTPFLEAYEAFLGTWGTDYRAVTERYEDPDALAALFGAPPEAVVLPNRQRLDRAGLQARLRSCSYLPGRGHPRYDAMDAAASALFEAHAEAGRVALTYDCVVYAGPLG